MATVTNKILGQRQVGTGEQATFLTLYTVPALTQAVVTLMVANLRSTYAFQNCTLQVSVAGAADDTSQRVWDRIPMAPASVALVPGPTLLLSGLCLGAGDVLRIKSSLGGTDGAVFTAYGQELS